MDISEVSGVVMNILTIITILGGIYIGFKKWIKKWIREVSRQLETSNGRTVGQYTEKTSHDLTSMREEISELKKHVSCAESIESRLKKLEDRFDSLQKG